MRLKVFLAVLAFCIFYFQRRPVSWPSQGTMAIAAAQEADAGPLSDVKPVLPGEDDAAAPAPVVAIPNPGTDGAGYMDKLLRAADPSQPGGVQWRLLLLCVLVGVVYALRAFGDKLVPKLGLGTDRGGAVLALVVGVATALVQMANAGKGFSLATVVAGVVVGATAAGGFNVVKRILYPKA